MFIYFLLLGIFLFLFFNESKHSHYYKEYNSISIVFFIILTLIMGLRDFSVGVDTELYYRIYTQVGNDVNPFYKISPIYYILIKFLNFLKPQFAFGLTRSKEYATIIQQYYLCGQLTQRESAIFTWWKSRVRIPHCPPSVMVYKSFLIDHHFCIFRGIFYPF